MKTVIRHCNLIKAREKDYALENFLSHLKESSLWIYLKMRLENKKILHRNCWDLITTPCNECAVQWGVCNMMADIQYGGGYLDCRWDASCRTVGGFSVRWGISWLPWGGILEYGGVIQGFNTKPQIIRGWTAFSYKRFLIKKNERMLFLNIIHYTPLEGAIKFLEISYTFPVSSCFSRIRYILGRENAPQTLQFFTGQIWLCSKEKSSSLGGGDKIHEYSIPTELTKQKSQHGNWGFGLLLAEIVQRNEHEKTWIDKERSKINTTSGIKRLNRKIVNKQTNKKSQMTSDCK